VDETRYAFVFITGETGESGQRVHMVYSLATYDAGHGNFPNEWVKLVED
jgi:hypothetical protein